MATIHDRYESIYYNGELEGAQGLYSDRHGFAFFLVPLNKMKQFRANQIWTSWGFSELDGINYISYSLEDSGSWCSGDVHVGLSDGRVEKRIDEKHTYCDGSWIPTHAIALFFKNDTCKAHNRYIELEIYNRFRNDGKWRVQNAQPPKGQPNITHVVKGEIDDIYIPIIIEAIERCFHKDFFDTGDFQENLRKNAQELFYIAYPSTIVGEQTKFNLIKDSRKGGKEKFSFMAKLLRTSNSEFILLPSSYVKIVDDTQRHYQTQTELRNAGKLQASEENKNLLAVKKAIHLGSSLSGVARAVLGRECQGPKIIRHFNSGLDYDRYMKEYEGLARITRKTRKRKEDTKNTEANMVTSQIFQDKNIQDTTDVKKTIDTECEENFFEKQNAISGGMETLDAKKETEIKNTNDDSFSDPFSE
jgi:hypothetical protein